jgi:hypothetical protein
MQTYNTAIETAYTTGTWTSPSVEIHAATLKNLSWNSTVITGDSVELYTRTGSTQALCEAAAWSAAVTLSGTQIASTADVWFQYKIEFTAVDTTVTNPKVTLSSGSLVKFDYARLSTSAETSVEFIYETGYKHFNMPMADKIYKRVTTYHSGSGGYIFKWQTENANDQFVIDMGVNTNRWDSFFHSTAMGRKLDMTIYKNDLNPLTFKELQLLWTPEPILI